MYKKPSKVKIVVDRIGLVLIMLLIIAAVVAAGGGALMVLFNTLHTDISGSVPALGYVPATLLVGSLAAVPSMLWIAAVLLVRAFGSLGDND